MYKTEEDTVTNFNWNVALQEYMFEYELVKHFYKQVTVLLL